MAEGAQRKTFAVAFAIAGKDLFDLVESSSSSDEDVPSPVTGFDTVVPSLRDDDFKAHFRVSRSTYELLLSSIGSKVSNEFVEHGGRSTVDVHKQTLMTLWMLATPDSYR
jgi:hypothetical protein